VSLIKRITIEEDQPIDVPFTIRERTLILDHAFADPSLTDPLAAADQKDDQLRVPFTLYDIEELCGFIAAAANHTADRKLRRDLQKLFVRLSDLMDGYDDGNWQGKL